MDTKLLSIMDYANQNNISISTVRRKIKKKEVKFKLSNGKYYIFPQGNELLDNVYDHNQLKVLENENIKLKNIIRQLEEEVIELKMLVSTYEYEKQLNFIR